MAASEPVSGLEAAAPPARSGAEADEAEGAGARDGVLARAGAQLVEQVLEMPLDRFVTHRDGLGDLLVGVVSGEQQQDAALLGRQRLARLPALAVLARCRRRRRAGLGVARARR